MKPLVSVIITTKNEENYLESTLKAIKDQTYPNIEIIVTDACSTDNTVKIARKYTDKVVIKKTNIAEGKNLGAKHANGKFLVFVSADTILDRNWIKNAIKDFNKENIVMVAGYFSFHERSIGARIYGWLWKLITFSSYRIRFFHTSGECTIMVRKPKFYSIGGFKNDLINMEDIDFTKRMKRMGKVVLEKTCRCVASARRFEKEGYIKWSLIWFVTGIWYYITGKSFLKTYKCVR